MMYEWPSVEGDETAVRLRLVAYDYLPWLVLHLATVLVSWALKVFPRIGDPVMTGHVV
jgi:hypothetical protein